jgi:hypothetical protein
VRGAIGAEAGPSGPEKEQMAAKTAAAPSEGGGGRARGSCLPQHETRAEALAAPGVFGRTAPSRTSRKDVAPSAGRHRVAGPAVGPALDCRARHGAGDGAGRAMPRGRPAHAVGPCPEPQEAERGAAPATALGRTMTFGALPKRVPASGPPYVYAREAHAADPCEGPIVPALRTSGPCPEEPLSTTLESGPIGSRFRRWRPCPAPSPSASTAHPRAAPPRNGLPVRRNCADSR